MERFDDPVVDVIELDAGDVIAGSCTMQTMQTDITTPEVEV